VDRSEILRKLKSGEISEQEADKLLDAAEDKKRTGLYCKVSAKGALSVYGLQRMPVTLYVEQWNRLLGFADELKKFITSHDAELKRKDAKGAPAEAGGDEM
jgi:hypothetical protein